MAEFKLPDVGEGLTEAEIVTWKVKEGDTVAINDIVVEIETAKSLVELPSPYAGIVQKLMVAEGETVPVGTPIIAIGDTAAAPVVESPPAEPIDLSNPAASGGGEGESLVGRNKADRSAVRRARHAAFPVSAGAAAAQQQLQGSFEPGLAAPVVVDVPDEPAVPSTAAPVSPAAARALAKPPVRKLAKDLGVDLTSLAGSGPGGAVTRDDVQAATGGLDSGAPSTIRRSAGHERRAGDPRADQGRPQDDGPGHGRLGLLDPPRHRVGDDRRHPHHGVRRPAEGPPRVPRRQGLAAARARARRDAGDAPHPRDQLLVGRRRAGGRLQELCEPRHRGRDAARARRTQRQGRRAALAPRPGRGRSTS